MIAIEAYSLSNNCWSASIIQNPASSHPTVSTLTATKISFLPVMFEITYAPNDISVKFRFMRVQSRVSEAFSWECIDLWAKPDAFSHEAICAALDEILKVEAFEVIEGPKDEELHREDDKRARDHGLVFAAIRKHLVPGNSG